MHSVQNFIQKCYYGVLPWILGTLCAIPIAYFAWKIPGKQSYSDLIAGAITMGDYYKDRDYFAFYVFIFSAVILSLVAGYLLKRLTQTFAKKSIVLANSPHSSAFTCSQIPNAHPKELISAFKRLFPLSLIPCGWFVGEILAKQPPALNLWHILPIAGIPALLIFSLLGLWRFRKSLTGTVINIVCGGTILITIFSTLSGLGLATFANRYLDVSSRSSVAAMLLLFGPLVVSVLWIVWHYIRARSPESLQKNISYALVASQTFLPLLLTVIIPPSSLPQNYKLSLPLFIWGMVALGLILVAVRFYRLLKGKLGYCDGLCHYIVPFCLACLAIFFLMPPFWSPFLGLDDFHFGEMLLPWQQWTHFGKLPYKDIISMQGFFAPLQGLLNSVFFDGTAANFANCELIIAASVVFLIFLVLSYSYSWMLALILVPFLSIDRHVLFVGLAFLLLASKSFLKSPRQWLILWIIISTIAVFYNIPSGIALALAGTPIAVWACSQIKFRQKFTKLELFSIVSAIFLACLLAFSATYNVLWNFISFIYQNVSSNTASYGIAFEQGLNTNNSGLPFFKFVLLRYGWIFCLPFLSFLAFREFVKNAIGRNYQVIIFSVLGTLTIVLLANYSLGRIDPGSLSRMANPSIVLSITVLPPLIFLLFRKSSFYEILLLILSVFLSFSSILPYSNTNYENLLSKALPQIPEQPPLVDGDSISFPMIGKAPTNKEKTQELLDTWKVLGEFLHNGETFLDLTNHQARYFYYNLPVPSPFPASYNASSYKDQQLMLSALKKNIPPVVIIAPAQNFDGLDATLRTYLIYREFTSNYVAQQRGNIVLLVDPNRISETVAESEQIKILNSVFAIKDFGKLPQAWGRSWADLKDQFSLVIDLLPLSSVSDLSPIAHQIYYVNGPSPALHFDLNVKSLNGSVADYALLNFMCLDSPKTLTANTIAIDYNDSRITFNLDQDQHQALIPLGSRPDWLRADSIDYLRLDFSSTNCKKISIKEFGLLQRQSLKIFTND